MNVESTAVRDRHALEVEREKKKEKEKKVEWKFESVWVLTTWSRTALLGQRSGRWSVTDTTTR